MALLRSFSMPLALLSGVLACSSVLLACGSSDSSDPPTIAQGQQAVATRQCVSCHGTDFAGQTQPQPSSKAYPANLTPDPETGIGEWDSATITKAILTGVDDEGASLCGVMPHFGNQGMTQSEAESIALFLKSLPPVSKAVPESECAEKGGS